MQPDTAVAVREDQHPIIAKIDAKMPEIAEMLPEGMDAGRFRRVVVQALVRNPDLWQCTPVSVVSAIVESAQVGLEPTGVLGRAWMLPYNTKQDDGSWRKEAKLIVGYRGYSELTWRADRILVTTGAVREGDDFEYRRGTGKYLHHIPASDDPEREGNDDNITDFWAMYTLPDGREDFDVMSRKAAERIRDRAKHKNPVWASDFGEMGRKTILRRLLKVAPLSPEVQRVLARDEEIDFDTPVERVADPKRDGLRDRITERTAAIRGEPTDQERDEAVEAGGATPTEPSSRSGDPWMRRLHALGTERGYDHEALHDWAARAFEVESLKDLTPPQRDNFMMLLERLPVMPPPGSGVPTADPVSGGDGSSGLPVADTPSSGEPVPDAATPSAGTVPPDTQPEVAPNDLMDDIIAVTGGEDVTPEPGTLESAVMRAEAKAAKAKVRA